MRRFPQQGLNCDQEYAETIDTMDRLLAIYAEIDAAIEATIPSMSPNCAKNRRVSEGGADKNRGFDLTVGLPVPLIRL